MKIIKSFKKTVSGEYVLTLCNGNQGDTVCGELWLDVPEAASISIESSVDGETWHAAKPVNMGNYDIKDSITEAGMYMLPTSGVNAVKMTAAAETEIGIKMLF